MNVPFEGEQLMKRGYDRTERIADLIQQSLAQLLLQDMGDERFKFVTITGVSVTRDLAHAKVYVSVLADTPEDIKRIVTALNHAHKSIRYNLAHAVKLRIVPELKFVYDETTAKGFHITDLINKANK